MAIKVDKNLHSGTVLQLFKNIFDTLQHDLSKDKVTEFHPENDVKSVIITLS